MARLLSQSLAVAILGIALWSLYSTLTRLAVDHGSERRPAKSLKPSQLLVDNGHLSSKQPYPDFQGDAFSAPNSCELRHVSLVSRHGSRHVTKIDAAQQLVDVLQAAAEDGKLTDFGKVYKKVVEEYLQVLPNVKGELSDVGRHELFNIGRREGRRHIEFYRTVEDKKLDILFESTHKSRSIESMRQFRAGLYSVTPMEEEDVHERIHSTCNSLPEYLHLRFFDVCTNFLNHVDAKPWKGILAKFSEHRYSDVPEEQAAYAGEESVVGRLFDLSWGLDRLRAEETGSEPIVSWGTKKRGTKKTLVQKKVDWEDFMDNVYELCQISFGAGLDGGVLCDPLMQPGSLPTLRALQVKEDVKTYHKRGAPAVASEMACPLLKALRDEFLEIAHHHEDTAAGRYRFGHAETIYPLLILLDLVPQVTRNATTGQPVNWSYMGHTPVPGALAIPMATNIRFELYDCHFQEHAVTPHIVAYHNERPVYLSPCAKHEKYLCPFDLVQKEWRQILDRLGGCDLDSFTEICGGLECSVKEAADSSADD